MILENPIFARVHVELGIAAAKNKTINLFFNKNSSYSPMVTGISSITNANYYYYDDEFSDELLDKIFKSIKLFKKNT